MDVTENEAYYLEAMKCFDETDPGFPSGSLYSTRDHPIQSFQWADYSAKPNHQYRYTVTALKGSPAALVPFASTPVDVTTESTGSQTHNVYFNRGTAASQEYIRRFGDRPPSQVQNNKAFEWLSRGLYEAMTAFIGSCIPGTDSLRIGAYEFNYEELLLVIKTAFDAGVDIRIVYDARKDKPGDSNRAAVGSTGLGGICTERTEGKSYISHNKFIVKLTNGAPVAVWTGGTNFSDGGIFGHSNVAHVVEDPAIAALYLSYWTELDSDPLTDAMRTAVEALTAIPPVPPPVGTSVIFSPRSDLEALQFYGELAERAEDGLFMTFAFGMNQIFKNVYQTSSAKLRMALMEKATRPMEDGPEKDAEEEAIQILRNMPENVFAIGDFIRVNTLDGWVRERLTGLNSNVRYVHNKFMLVDPLSADPVVVSGSANFSAASTNQNDENMLVIRGSKRVADIYFGEYMRLFSHFAFRESLKWRSPDDPPKPLRTDDWWKDYFGSTERSARRKYFSSAAL
jgi:phosphatidylserine/phosphatidylglycerophosphate/cardiolipin synthase-like enzyme